MYVVQLNVFCVSQVRLTRTCDNNSMQLVITQDRVNIHHMVTSVEEYLIQQCTVPLLARSSGLESFSSSTSSNL
jgi:hypothetical protein